MHRREGQHLALAIAFKIAGEGAQARELAQKRPAARAKPPAAPPKKRADPPARGFRMSQAKEVRRNAPPRSARTAADRARMRPPYAAKRGARRKDEQANRAPARQGQDRRAKHRARCLPPQGRGGWSCLIIPRARPNNSLPRRNSLLPSGGHQLMRLRADFWVSAYLGAARMKAPLPCCAAGARRRLARFLSRSTGLMVAPLCSDRRRRAK